MKRPDLKFLDKVNEAYWDLLFAFRRAYKLYPDVEKHFDKLKKAYEGFYWAYSSSNRSYHWRRLLDIVHVLWLDARDYTVDDFRVIDKRIKPCFDAFCKALDKMRDMCSTKKKRNEE